MDRSSETQLKVGENLNKLPGEGLIIMYRPTGKVKKNIRLVRVENLMYT